MSKKFTAGRIAEALDAQFSGSPDKEFTGITSIDLADENKLTFADGKHLKRLAGSSAGGVIVPEMRKDIPDKLQFAVKDVNEALIKVLEMFALEPAFEPKIEPTAAVDENAKISSKAYIGDFVLVRGDVKIADGAVVKAGVKIQGPCEIGENTVIDSNCVLYPRTRIGRNCLIHAGTVIGATGYGYRPVNQMPKLIPHNGGVVIEDFVDIGANSCVDRAKFGDTVIGAGTKIDNLCQIAHNVKVGKCCLIAGQSGIGGSTVTGDGCILAGNSGAIDNIELGDKVTICATSTALKNLESGRVIAGPNGIDRAKYLKSQVLVGKLPEIVQRLKALEKRLNNETEND
ncbi:UDP-3-O-(3-hydroxymyristoyl)glucosamine N-acyltransferase [Sedimentisphaera salicampi]|uniref:UDP-3-O-(3-hydroxymyristoyl)glucosamine N-acyltransferase n=1 Tax=Sedimentisphaera salicampi TaxID=1941349 RepID=UPI000B9C3DC9|nr:UDP-3-O-(3-hydroxymyristoyl)glucosamine N-acyltransferase [Sedimentisphaera salicampi]OXU16193.1 UDP-3-O-acylglucosamine N-acyltransferase [Sedimentisphaera salicampi]